VRAEGIHTIREISEFFERIMSTKQLSSWHQNNHEFLTLAVEWIRLRLLSLAPTKEGEATQNRVDEVGLERTRKAMMAAASGDPPPALLALSRRLRLSTFEQEVLLLCIAMELDQRIPALCAQAQRDARRAYPTFLLTFALFENSSWNILSPERALRHWRLIEIHQPPERPLTTSPIRADERVVSYVKGINYLDERLSPFLFRVKTGRHVVGLPPSQQTMVDEALRNLTNISAGGTLPVIQLVGIDVESKQFVVEQIAASFGLQLYRLPAELLPSSTIELQTFARLWERESLLLPVALHIEAHEINTEGADKDKSLHIHRFLMRSDGIFFLDTRDVWIGLGRHSCRLDIEKPTPAEQEAAWASALAPQPPPILGGEKETEKRETKRDVLALAAQFNLSIAKIHAVVESTKSNSSANQPSKVATLDELWDACLVHTRPRMDSLAQRITPKATWEQIVLPEKQLTLLRRIVEQVNLRHTVYDKWGFRKRSSRGLGMNVLFAGESGTGKTMAAEILANELRLNLYRIDLSAVVSKYIGETEKNLRKLFDAAEDGGAILFFDEADALFGKRSQVKDSHDRYANIEVNYLLQRIEAYQGLSILATNLKSGLDDAFMRRLRFVVSFPFPEKEYRAEIWKRIFPAEMPLGVLNYRRLAKFKLPGGSIYNIALNAAFRAAKEQSPVTMHHALQAIRQEFYKQDRLVNERDFIWEGKSVL
jgi:ATP-dependent 26S proteasome regulatory subunit